MPSCFLLSESHSRHHYYSVITPEWIRQAEGGWIPRRIEWRQCHVTRTEEQCTEQQHVQNELQQWNQLWTVNVFPSSPYFHQRHQNMHNSTSGILHSPSRMRSSSTEWINGTVECQHHHINIGHWIMNEEETRTSFNRISHLSIVINRSSSQQYWQFEIYFIVIYTGE